MTFRRLLPLLWLAFACEGGRVELGGACASSWDCEDGDVCFRVGSEPADEGHCMTTCEAGTVLCEDDTVCTASVAEPEVSVCFLGGERAIGEGCEATTQCVAGAYCVDVGDGTPVCRAACDRGAPICVAGFTCEPLEGERPGYCAPPETE